MNIKGKIFVFGDNVNTDEIIPARHLITTDPEKLARHCMEDIRQDFAQRKDIKGSIIAAGENFGCGSSREHAPIALKGAGIRCIIAKSFARIFLRNSINIGLPIVELKNISCFKEEDRVEINLNKGTVKNLSTEKEFTFNPYPDFMQEIIESGGWLHYARKNYDPNKLDDSQDIAQFHYKIENIPF